LHLRQVTKAKGQDSNIMTALQTLVFGNTKFALSYWL